MLRIVNPVFRRSCLLQPVCTFYFRASNSAQAKHRKAFTKNNLSRPFISKTVQLIGEKLLENFCIRLSSSAPHSTLPFFETQLLPFPQDLTRSCYHPLWPENNFPIFLSLFCAIWLYRKGHRNGIWIRKISLGSFFPTKDRRRTPQPSNTDTHTRRRTASGQPISNQSYIKSAWKGKTRMDSCNGVEGAC